MKSTWLRVFALFSLPLLLAPVAMRQAAGAPLDDKFSFDNPPGPQFTEAQKQAQHRLGAQVVPQVRKAFDSGAAAVVIPPGDYRFGTESWGPNGPIYPLEFRGLKRTAANPFRIVAEGVTFWFDLPPDQTPRAHFALGLVDCSHFALEGVALDRDPRGNMEGRITQFDDAHQRIEIEATPGSFIPTRFNGDLNQRVVPFKADGAFCTAFYALQRKPGQLRYRSVEAGTRPGRYWVNLDEKSQLLQLNRDPAWRRAYGMAGTLQVGDGLSLIYTTTLAIDVIDCSSLTLVGIKNYITKGTPREVGGGGGHLWKNCYFGPRPGTCRWQGSDGFLTDCLEHGSRYDGITMLHTSDDLFNIHGFWGYVEQVAGNTITIQRDHQMPARAGDRLNFFDRQSGLPLGTAVVQSVDRQTLTLNRDAAALAQAVAENPRWQGDGWEIRNCTFRDCYQRLLVQGGNGGTLRDCTFTRVGSSIQLHSNFFTNNEGGICRGIRVLNNLFDQVAIAPDGVVVEVGFQSLDHHASTRLLSDIVVRGNKFIDSSMHAVDFALVDGGEISQNTFTNSGQPHAIAGKGRTHGDPRPVQIRNCANIRVHGNALVVSESPGSSARVDSKSLVHATDSRDIMIQP